MQMWVQLETDLDLELINRVVLCVFFLQHRQLLSV